MNIEINDGTDLYDGFLSLINEPSVLVKDEIKRKDRISNAKNALIILSLMKKYSKKKTTV